MSSSSESVDSDTSSSSISIPNISKLQPYDLEPTIPSSEVSSNSNSDEGTSDSEQEKERIGNTDWCVWWEMSPNGVVYRKFMLS